MLRTLGRQLGKVDRLDTEANARRMTALLRAAPMASLFAKASLF